MHTFLTVNQNMTFVMAEYGLLSCIGYHFIVQMIQKLCWLG